MINTVSILGCGWLGLPLGEFLLRQGVEVKGSTTRPDRLSLLAEVGIQPFLLHFQPHLPAERLGELEVFLTSHILIIAIPPQVERQGEDFHPAQIRHLTGQLESTRVQTILYVSSTSVYPEINREVDETEILTGHNATSRAILRAEKLVREWGRDWVILRCGGLMGYNRIPGKYVAGRKGLTSGDVPVNFVHRDDVTSSIWAVMQGQNRNGVYNVVAPEHPVRREIYARNARQFGYALPEYSDGPGEPYKIVSSRKLIRESGYQFRYANPLDFPYSP